MSKAYQAINETERSRFSSFQRVPASPVNADSKVKEIAEAALEYPAEITRKGQAN